MTSKFIKTCFLLLFIVTFKKSFSQPDSLSNSRPEKFVTKHSVKIENRQINYTAIVGTLILKNEKDEPIASFGYTAYTKDGETDMTKRPLTFSFNGGPGSSSMWLHLGVMGPRRVVVNDPSGNGPAPYKLEDNNYSILDISDIVMMDPVGTGISRAVGKAKNSDFWGVDQDIKSVSQFIKNYIHENERWNSPKYLLGESYGTFRSAGAADYLQSNFGISLNGIILVSNVLDIRTLSYNPGDDISYVVNFPTYAATSWYHNKLANKPASLEAFLKDVRTFSFGEYATALLKGDQLTNSEREVILNKLAGFTGISKDYWDKANLRVNQPQFAQEVLRNAGMMVGRLDSRYVGITTNLLSEFASNDPQSSTISPAYISAFMNYYTTELKVSKDKTYNTSAYSLTDFKWDWKHARSQGIFGDAVSPTTAPDLLNAMTNNPSLKILVMNGIYDMATPFGGTEYTFDHLGLDKKLKANVIQKYYEAGHMMYIHPASAAKYKKDLVEFILSTVK
ncbi:MAG: S10 family peptidase [Chitinophagaceae bacterium]